MTEPDWTTIRARLAGKWQQNLIRKATKQGNKVYSYLDARDLMAFLDEVVGPQHWSTESEVVDSAACVVRCTLSIHGIPKTDFGYPNNPVGGGNKFAEPLKEAQTDAFKRAAVLWGPGREFYTDISNYRWSTEDAVEHSPTPARERERYTPAQRDATPDEAKAEAARAQAKVQDALDGSFPQASPYRTASANQLATVAKLSRLLGHPEEPGEDMTSAEAAERITELSREYNSRKGVVAASLDQPSTQAKSNNDGTMGGIAAGQMNAIQKLAPQAGDTVPGNLAEWSYLEAAAYITALQERIAARKVPA